MYSCTNERENEMNHGAIQLLCATIFLAPQPQIKYCITHNFTAFFSLAEQITQPTMWFISPIPAVSVEMNYVIQPK